MKNPIKRIINFIRSLLSEDYLVELAEIYLASGKVSPQDVAMIRLMIEEIQKEGTEKAVKKEIKRKLRRLLADYLKD